MSGKHVFNNKRMKIKIIFLFLFFCSLYLNTRGQLIEWSFNKTGVKINLTLIECKDSGEFVFSLKNTSKKNVMIHGIDTTIITFIHSPLNQITNCEVGFGIFNSFKNFSYSDFIGIISTQFSSLSFEY